jgi:hypothetical protein
MVIRFFGNVPLSAKSHKVDNSCKIEKIRENENVFHAAI